MMSHDARDTNNDGKVSLMEKVKDKLHLHHKDKDAQYTQTTTGHASGIQTSTASGHSSGADLNHDGRISAGEKLASAGLAGSHSSGSSYSSTSSYSSGADLNHDGRISAGEKLVSSHSSYSSSGVHDSRDLNRDGHVSTSERLAAGSSSAMHDSRDLNRDGHVSMGERLEGHIGDRAHRDEAAVLRLHEEQLAVSKREAVAGEVDIHKRVHQEHVQQTVPVRHEEILIERRALSGPAEPGARIASQDEVVRVDLFREELVTEKRIVPTEEVIVRKKEVVENQTVGATLRSEYVETHQTQVGAYDARDTNRDGHVSMGEKLKGDHMHTTGAIGDARDTNRDGHVSMGEKLKSADMRGSAYDARDMNRDGNVSMGEKIKDAVGMNPATKAARG